MNEQNNTKVESFDLDHTKVKAPYVRMCSVYTGEKGDVVTKFDVRFTQPNKAEMESDGLHTLEHLMATYLRELFIEKYRGIKNLRLDETSEEENGN